MSEIRGFVRNFILTECLPGETPDNLPDDMSLKAGGVLDSMTTLKLVKALEDELEIEIDAHEVSDENFASVDSIVDFVESRGAVR